MIKKLFFYTSIFLFLAAPLPIWGQSHFYDLDSVRQIKIYFDEDNWDAILDSFYAQKMGQRLVGNVEIDGTLLLDVGIRYKGYSSASTDRVKNPFNIDLDYTHEDQDYQGYDKLKLSNVIHDPSFLREVLAYEIAGNYMPVSQANFAQVYVNDQLLGLYTNVEAVDKSFLNSRFGSKREAFFKGNPETIDLNGENSNLANSHGTDPMAYSSYYTLKSDDSTDWYQLYQLIETLNEKPDSVEKMLNVDRSLWMHAFNYAIINFDSYIGYAQNYYLYQRENGQFEPILWDMNQAFASYRLTDASLYWQGFSVSEAPKMDPLAHVEGFSVYPRPLIRNLLEESTRQRMYLAHIRTLMETHFDNEAFYQRAEELQAFIAPYVKADPNAFYGYENFEANIDETVQDLIEYPGIGALMKERSAYLKSYPGIAGAPEIESVVAAEPHIIGEDLWIQAKAPTAERMLLAYRFSKSDVFQQADMWDDGQHNDGSADDGLFGASIPTAGNLVQYYVYAENDSAGRFSPEKAAFEFYISSAPLPSGSLVINEFMASNRLVFSDEKGEYDDWIELYNPNEHPISTLGLLIHTENSTEGAWSLPDRIIAPKGYLIVWMDDDTGQGDRHAHLKLKSEGGSIYLMNDNGDVFDQVDYEEQDYVASYGRYPNGSGDFDFMPASPGVSNGQPSEELLEQSLYLYPNPANHEVYVDFKRDNSYQIKVVDAQARIVLEVNTNGQSVYKLSTSDLPPGLYFVRAVGTDYYETRTLIIAHN